MTPQMEMPPNFMAHQNMSETPVSHGVDIEELRRQHSHGQSPQTTSIVGSPQVEGFDVPSDRAVPIKQLSELDLELSKLIPKGSQQAVTNVPVSAAMQASTSQQQSVVKLYSEVVRQQSITVSNNEPQNVCITTTGVGDETVSVKGTEESNSLQPTAPPPMVRKVSRFQVSTVVEQQQMQQLQQQQNQVEEKTVLITPGNSTPSSTVTVHLQHMQPQPSDQGVVFQQQLSQG